ncbi:hypothetical protein TNCV_1338941 [Trichonephila clavipes]|nr:hypothetical protein TNCV_1338941 [Trichonephila clavipes]
MPSGLESDALTSRLPTALRYICYGECVSYGCNWRVASSVSDGFWLVLFAGRWCHDSSEGYAFSKFSSGSPMRRIELETFSFKINPRFVDRPVTRLEIERHKASKHLASRKSTRKVSRRERGLRNPMEPLPTRRFPFNLG